MLTSRFRARFLETALGRIRVRTRGFVAEVRGTAPDAADELPAPLADALAEAGADRAAPLSIPRAGRTLLRAGRLLGRRAERATLPVELTVPADGVAAVSTDGSGVVHWHLPPPEDAARPGSRLRAAGIVPRSRPDSLRRLFRLGGEARHIHLVRFRAPGEAPHDGPALARLLPALECLAKRSEGLKRFPASTALLPFRPPRPADPALLSGGRSLLLVHGLLDGLMGGGFGWMLLPRGRPFLRELERRYEGRIVGFDHWTLARTPLENATDLLAALPAGAELDVVCHSRGGLIVRTLLEHPDVRPVLLAKGIRVRTAVFVGAANQGSELAVRENWDRLLTVWTNLWLQTPIPGAPAAVRMLAAVARAAVDGVGAIPSLEALVPGGAYLRALDEAPGEPLARYAFVRANYGNAAGRVFREVDALADDAFEGRPNDLVVPFEGMAGVGRRARDDWPRLDLGTAREPQGACFHANYLDQEPVRRFLLDVLGE